MERAAAIIASVVPATPLVSFSVDGRTVFAKCESFQPTGAFKLRGGWYRLKTLSPSERARGVVAFSSGNHAQGVAWAANRLGIAAAIVMPSDAPANKIAATRALGAEIILYDRVTQSREGIAAALSSARGATLVPSFDDPWIVEGQGSAGIEIIAQLAAFDFGPPDAIVTPCGGGGLGAGLALACPDAAIVVVEPDGWDDMGASLRTGCIVPVAPDAPPTACDALMTQRVSNMTFEILARRGATGLSVSEIEIEAAIRFAFDRLRIVVEPGGAVALAALLCGKIAPTDRMVVIISGGNVDPTHYAAVLGRS